MNITIKNSADKIHKKRIVEGTICLCLLFLFKLSFRNDSSYMSTYM